MNAVDRKPAFWIAYTLLALVSLAVAWKLFPFAIPLVNLDITMSRDAALAQAKALAVERGLVAADARSAARFAHDDLAQNYIELEGGGKPAFAQLVAGGAYAPYWWQVRLFKAGTIEEASVKFRPDGRINGFSRRVAETHVRDAAAMALDPAAALALAQELATRDWGIDFAGYALLEQSQRTQTSGRIDHSFVFEHEGKIAEARIRLRIVVAGDELTTVDPFVHVPESFQRRFQELRSASNTIAGVAGIAAGVLYGVFGCILGALWLLRRHWLVWQPALVAGLTVGALLGLTALAATPGAWFSFSTAQDENSFWIRQVGAAGAVFLGGGLLLGFVFMAAESLSRRAFPHHPQLWRLWSRDAGGTVETAGRTAGGYLFVPVELALIAVFYFATNRWLGWWQPSSALTDPNILSSLVPALAPIAISLQAGFMEECVFRAVPLALGALLGAHFGRRNLGIGIAFVLQALIFGAAHANYPGLPAYSRLVELFVPSLLWAAIFLRYGLLPTILLHALFNLVLFSIPLFLIDAPGATLQRALVIAAGLVPAAIVLARRIQAGRWEALPEGLRNGAWQPHARPVAAPERAVVAGVITTPALRLQRVMPVLGVAGLAAWGAFGVLRADVPPLTIDRAQAEGIARAAVLAQGVSLGPEWRQMAVVRLAPEEGVQRLWHRFVWREAGPDAYRALVGSALAPPLWEVRYARFDGDVAERAEEWRVAVAGNGDVRQFVHRLPEARPGASLERPAAEALAEAALRQAFGTDPAALVLRSADQAQREARRDWGFVYADPRVNVGKDGELRLQIIVGGDRVLSTGRAVFVPEAWQRAEARRADERQFVKMASLVVIGLVALAALVYAVFAWNRHRSDRRAMLIVGGVSMATLLASSANNWPALAIQLRTAEPVLSQLTTSILGMLAGALLVALVFGLLGGVGAWYARGQPAVALAGRLPSWAMGVAAALATAGITTLLTSLMPPSLPAWPDLKVFSTAWPAAGAVLSAFSLVPALAVTLFLLAVIDRGTAGWTRRIPLAGAVLVLFGVAVALLSGLEVVDALRRGVVEGLVALAFAWLVLRYDLTTVPAFVATGLLLEGARNAALGGTLSGWWLFALGAATTVALAWAATRFLGRRVSARA